MVRAGSTSLIVGAASDPVGNGNAADPLRASGAQDSRPCRHGRPSGDDVIDDEQTCRHPYTAAQCQRWACQSLSPVETGLMPGVGPTKRAPRRYADPSSQRTSEQPTMVEALLGSPRVSCRNPGDELQSAVAQQRADDQSQLIGQYADDCSIVAIFDAGHESRSRPIVTKRAPTPLDIGYGNLIMMRS